MGLIGAESAPEQVPVYKPALRQAPNRPKQSGRIQDEYRASGSKKHFTVIRSDDDYFAAESNPFEDFHAFDHDPNNPYAASHTNREDYISPYASSSGHSQKIAFDDYGGPPKGFFDTEFLNFGRGGGGGSGGEKSVNPQESQSESKVEEGIKHDPKTKKCEKVKKDDMICEVSRAPTKVEQNIKFYYKLNAIKFIY